MAEVPAAGRREAGIEIREAVERWALWRDTGRWEKLAALYTPDAIQHTTWFVGPAREFIERCKEAASRGGGMRGQHFVGAVCVEVAGERAIAETRAMLLVRGKVHDVEVDVTCYCRMYDFFLRTEDGWRIRTRAMIYEKDRMDAVDPAMKLELRKEELAHYPEGYRHVAYLQAASGMRITPELPTPGSESLKRLYGEGDAWLRRPPND